MDSTGLRLIDDLFFLNGILLFELVDDLPFFHHPSLFPGDFLNFILIGPQPIDLLPQSSVIFLQPGVVRLDPVSLFFELVDLHEPPATEEGEEEHAGDEQPEEKKVFLLEGPKKAHEQAISFLPIRNHMHFSFQK